MEKMIAAIKQADGSEIQAMLQAVLQRYGELFPDWEVSAISVCKDDDRNVQLDRIIDVLEKMKTLP